MPYEADSPYHSFEDKVEAPVWTCWRYEVKDVYFPVIKPGDNLAERDNTSPAKLVATLGMDVPRGLLQVKPKSLSGERLLWIKYRAVPMWDGLEARWWMVSVDLPTRPLSDHC
jgi:hypothetical protein